MPHRSLHGRTSPAMRSRKAAMLARPVMSYAGMRAMLIRSAGIAAYDGLMAVLHLTAAFSGETPC